MKVTLSALALGVALCGCAANALPTAEDAQAAALEAVPDGDATGAERIVDGGYDVWQVTVAMPNGAELAVLLFVDSGELYEIVDSTGPFDYELAPRDGVGTFSESMARALNDGPGTVEAWELKWTPAQGRYFWEFYVRDDGGQLYELKHWADTGELISFQAVTMMD